MRNLFTISFLTGLLPFLANNPALAQLIPDQSLGNENSLVNSNNNLQNIEGGAIRGNNLFHSFQEFNVKTNQEVFFNNPINIQSIFTRVTGGNVSNIDGLISNVGQADLFILNPAGIIFGENAQLNIGGSFFATTAESILFSDNTKFSANDLSHKPLLTINAPIGLNLQNNSQPIVNSSIDNGFELRVNPGKNITLIGGNISFENGRLFAPGGSIQLGGLYEAGKIKINNNGNLTFPDGVILGDVSLVDSSVVSVASEKNGSIRVNAKNFTLTNGSQFRGGIVANQSSEAY